MGLIFNRGARQSACRPCDSQYPVVQSSCGQPQPLILSTPYGSCQPCQPQRFAPAPMGFAPAVITDVGAPTAMPAITITDVESKPAAKEKEAGKDATKETAKDSKKDHEKDGGRDKDRDTARPDRKGRRDRDADDYDGRRERPRWRRERESLNIPSPSDLFDFNGGAKDNGDKQPGRFPERDKQTPDQELKSAREQRLLNDQLDDFKKQVEQLRAEQAMLLAKIAQLQQAQRPVQPLVPPPGAPQPLVPPPGVPQPVVPPPGAPRPVVPPPGAQQPFVPPPPGAQQPFVPPPVEQPRPPVSPVAPQPFVPPPPGAPQRPVLPPVAPPTDAKAPVGPGIAPAPGGPRPWEGPSTPVPSPAIPGQPPRVEVPQVPVPSGQPPRVEVPQVPVPPGQPPRVEVPQVPVPPGQPPRVEAPKLTPPTGPKPGDRPPVAPPKSETAWKTAVEDTAKTIQAQKDKKLDDLKAPFEKYMASEKIRLSRALATKGVEHPETVYDKTRTLLEQGNENLIQDFRYRKKLSDIGWQWSNDDVKKEEDKVRDERQGQWEQIKTNSLNPADPNMKTKQSLLQEVMIGYHLDSAMQFGRVNKERGDAPLKNDKLKWQVEAAETLVKVNQANGIDHDFSTRAIIHGLTGSAGKEGQIFFQVPEAARVKLLDAIVPMAQDAKTKFLDDKAKDVALATCLLALERSHDSRRAEESFQVAAIAKLGELKDPRAVFLLERIAAESAMQNVKTKAAAQAAALRAEVK